MLSHESQTGLTLSPITTLPLTTMIIPTTNATAVETPKPMPAPKTLEPKPLIPPLHFGVINSNLYRGSHPRSHNYRFLRRLRLSTIVSLTPQPPSEELHEFARQQGINVVWLECGSHNGKSKKKRGVAITSENIVAALSVLLRQSSSPAYVHCMNGTDVVVVLVACLRRLQFWSMASIASEAGTYGGELSVKDQIFVEKFNARREVRANLKEGDMVKWLWKGMSKEVIEGLE
ncbi:hypothetical protein NADFUDRAFT_83199 [Nadsonia fulvescens var. elongata DSM 6958]|uniref:Protein-tyrosine phosphatase n=1 Tax=Nadsonia fulvescens var. elongata DSM 6958 TaxID=857566 RepID=A0A1E3PI84_9ASCO|nr:hypothetical protein NADFUDRAFT_83199 [Nadsonia fulvescens var. elongata DSM 6958]